MFMGRIELGAQLVGLGNGHVRSLEKSHAGGAPLRVWICQPAIDCLAHDGGNRNATFAGGGGNSLVTLVVYQDLKTMLKWHAHTVA
jgi:hypothetical protein